MDAIDRYIERLSDPAVRSYLRKLNRYEDDSGMEAGETEVKAAEDDLGVALPPSYRKLITTTNSIDNLYGLYWVFGDGLDTFGAGIVAVNRGPHSYLPSFLIAVLGDDSGDEYWFDTRYPDDRGEYPIVHFDHEIHSEDSADFETVAADLGEFLLGILSRIP
jgi:hypothetical protein